MKQKILFLLMVILLCRQPHLHAGTCTGSAGCRACSNCSQCGHCAKRGGSCGVCENRNEHRDEDRSEKSYSVATKTENSFWNPKWTWIIVGVLGLYILANNKKRDQ